MSTASFETQKEYNGKRFYGKYRGKVINNVDPHFKGRILAYVPSVSPFTPISWANPCSPYAGPGVGMFFVPPLAANVWIEFEEGNPQYPIWTGGFWSEVDLAFVAPNPFLKPGDFKIRTFTGNSITLSDTPPSLKLETIDLKKISLDVTGIEISWLGTTINFLPDNSININNPGRISIKSLTNVSINGP